MKKNYNNPKVESVKVMTSMRVCQASPGGLDIQGDLINGGEYGADPATNL